MISPPKTDPFYTYNVFYTQKYLLIYFILILIKNQNIVNVEIKYTRKTYYGNILTT